MCELLAMSALAPTSLTSSLAELARHGGETGPHRDGWGVAYMRDGDAFLVREPDAAAGSELLAFLQQRDSQSALVDGELIFAHGHRRRGDGGEIRPPGLYMLCRRCVERAAVAQQVALVASVPLTTEAWRPLAEGELIVLRDGRMIPSSHVPRRGAVTAGRARGLAWRAPRRR